MIFRHTMYFTVDVFRQIPPTKKMYLQLTLLEQAQAHTCKSPLK